MSKWHRLMCRTVMCRHVLCCICSVSAENVWYVKKFCTMKMATAPPVRVPKCTRHRVMECVDPVLLRLARRFERQQAPLGQLLVWYCCCAMSARVFVWLLPGELRCPCLCQAQRSSSLCACGIAALLTRPKDCGHIALKLSSSDS